MIEVGDHRQRAIDLASEFGITKERFLEEGFSEGQFYRWFSKTSTASPSLDNLSLFCNVFDISPTYLMYGVGEKRLSQAASMLNRLVRMRETFFKMVEENNALLTDEGEGSAKQMHREVSQESNALLKDIDAVFQQRSVNKRIDDLVVVMERIESKLN